MAVDELDRVPQHAGRHHPTRRVRPRGIRATGVPGPRRCRAEELLQRAWDENADPFTDAVRTTVSALRVTVRLPAAPPRPGP
ncbi:helix-turn-helix domain-containing protein [Kineococcus indalonis]|uniref:hypothetical protein n=1 Tax=Kineococcus indalonis TaxID=2696566 RepID=UPI00196BA3F5